MTSADQQRIAELERAIKELHRANEILKGASAFFARELDPRSTDQRSSYERLSASEPLFTIEPSRRQAIR